MELEITTERDGSSCVLSLSGEIDVYTAPTLKERIVSAIDDGCVEIVLDLENVAFIDSSGLGVLVGGLRRVREKDGSLRIVCTRDGVLKIFRITGLDKVFPVFASQGEARGF